MLRAVHRLRTERQGRSKYSTSFRSSTSSLPAARAAIPRFSSSAEGVAKRARAFVGPMHVLSAKVRSWILTLPSHNERVFGGGRARVDFDGGLLYPWPALARVPGGRRGWVGVPVVDSVKIRSYPKAIFLYPLFLVSIFCAVWAARAPATSMLPGRVFFVAFA